MTTIKYFRKMKLGSSLMLLLIVLIAICGIFLILDAKLTGKAISGEINDSKIIINELNDSVYSGENLSVIFIKNVKREGNILNIAYDFNSRDYVGDGISVYIWLVDSDGNEIKRTIDGFLLNKDIISRNVAMELPERTAGVYNIRLALISNPEKFISQNIILGDSYSTGFTILDEPRNKIIGYGIFILIILAGVFFIVKNYWNSGGSFDDEETDRKK